MILQALKEFYDRKGNLPKFGFEEKEIPYIIVLDVDGKPVNLYSTYEEQDKSPRAKKYNVPQSVNKTSGIASNLLWDKPEYVLGISSKGKRDRVANQHEAFKNKIKELGDIPDSGLNAVKKFLSEPDKSKLLEPFADVYNQMLDKGANLTFKLAGDDCIVLERPAVKEAIEKRISLADGQEACTCIITGCNDFIERLHPPIKGVRGAKKRDAKIVSFNCDSFTSFGKKQGANAPIGKKAAFEYTTALNYLLAKDSRQRIQVGDASTVFWSKKNEAFEEQFPYYFINSEPQKDAPDKNVMAVKSLYNSIKTGAFSPDDSNDLFYVLGLAPNAARISIRFWVVDTVANLAKKIAQHFEDLRILHGPNEQDYISLFRLLDSTVVKNEKVGESHAQDKSSKVLPNIAGDTMRSILEGLPYPKTLLQAVIRRIRAGKKVTYCRAALIKACINRQTRYINPERKEELKVSLDRTNLNVGYRLGRLFAALEKIQEEANPGINATIRDRFYGAASGTPSTVFGNLMRLKNHHLAKLENTGRRIYFEKLLAEILDGIDACTAFPAHLNLDDQGRFAVGYYHQMQDFYTKKAEKNN